MELNPIYNHQPPRPLPDEENTVHYTDERREQFEETITVSDLSAQPPWWGAQRIVNIILTGEIVEEFEYEVTAGHRDPATEYSTYSYEDLAVEFWTGTTLVLRYELSDMTESDVTWGRFTADAEVDAASDATQPYLRFLTDNRELAGYLPEEIR